ncbi:FG-GAP repeat domain-containing protein [Salinimonas lutimaris]|uniref:FG-GAP repeat domain-containing protein n=1 Tax=Salinimonas lutimaris TaxID=914153 RepID=UPI0010C037D3|nr:VCBS repeat-containing protein [Salinimonas lutimaris]
MKITRYGFLAVMASTLVVACGGGSGDSGADTDTPSSGSTPVVNETSASEMISNATSHSVSQLNNAARSLASTRYTGSVDKADMDIVLAQQVARILLDDEFLIVPELVTHDVSGDVSPDGKIDTRVACDESGSVRYTGQIDESGEATLSIDFDNCKSYYNHAALSGVAALIVVVDQQQETGSYTMYFDNVRWQDEQSIALSGLMKVNESTYHDPSYPTSATQYLTVKVDDEIYFIDAVMTEVFEWGGQTESMQGRLSVASRGYVDFELKPEVDAYGLNGSVLLFNDNEAYVNFEQDQAAYVADTDNDGIKDAAKVVYFYDFMSPMVIEAGLSPLSDVSTFPYADRPYLNQSNYVVSSDIEVTPGYFFDIETPRSQLNISYNWYINGVLAEDIHGPILPAYSATANDFVTVAMVVADEAHHYESDQVDIWIEDTPAQLTISDVPQQIKAGNTVSFSVVMSDSDIQSADNLAKLTLAPEGAVMNDEGIITWQVPDNLLFNEQTYYFGISNRFDPNENVEQTLALTVGSEQSLPLFRSGIEVPAANRSQWVVDIDGDGRNELLGTDNQSRVFLLALENAEYQQQWAYPYLFSKDELIKQVLPVRADQPGAKSILVLTNHNMWLIDDLSQPARNILTTDDFLRSAILVDIDGDGAEELIYHSSSSDWDGAVSSVTVAALTDTLTGAETVISEVEFTNMAVGNVDADANLELVVNTGLVTDLISGDTQWSAGTGFGTQVATGDLQGDGIDEIIGADSWGAVYVYSAVDKTQLDSFDVSHICDLAAFDLDENGADELVVSDCQWGEVRAFTLDSTDKLTLQWSVDVQEHGSSSLSAGDIDNDGAPELLWGSGVSSSMGNVLVTADIDGVTVTVNQELATVQLDAFSASGWANTGAENEQAIFLVPTTGNGDNGLAVAALQKDGNVKRVGQVDSSWWNTSIYSAIIDINHDDIDDILVSNNESFISGLGAYQLNDFSELWTLEGDQDASTHQIILQDINGDASDEAVVANGNVIKIIDLQTQEELASYRFAEDVVDFDVTDIDGVSTVVVALYNKLHILTVNDSRFVVDGTAIETQCNNVLFYGKTGEKKVACLLSDYASALKTMTLTDNQLTNLNSYNLSINAVDIVVDPTNPDGFIVASDNGDFWNYGHSQLHSMTSQGELVWSGPFLIGSANKASLQVREQDSGKLEILFGSSKGMYWIH